VLKFFGRNKNLMYVQGDYIVFDYLELQGSKDDVNVFRLRGICRGITVQNCVFYECGGVNLDANGGKAYYDLRVLHNYFIDTLSTSVYIGSHGGEIIVEGYIFEGNFIDGWQINNPGIIGYGIEIKLNVTCAILRNNFVMNTQGPGLMVYGTQTGVKSDANIIEKNIAVGTRNSAGIVVGSGPAIVQDNLILGCPGGGVSVMNYGGRNLTRNVDVLRNTAAANSYGFSIYGHDGSYGLVLKDNIAINRPSARAYSVERIAADKALISKNNLEYEASHELCDKVAALSKMKPDADKLWKAYGMLDGGPYSPEKTLEILNVLLG